MELGNNWREEELTDEPHHREETDLEFGNAQEIEVLDPVVQAYTAFRDFARNDVIIATKVARRTEVRVIFGTGINELACFCPKAIEMRILKVERQAIDEPACRHHL